MTSIDAAAGDARPLTLTEVVLLACDFWVKLPEDDEDGAEPDTTGAPGQVEAPREVQTPADEAPEIDGPTDQFVPVVELEGVEVSYTTDEQLDEFSLITRVRLTDPTAPYTFELVMGSRFTKPEPAVTVEEAAATLLFMSYPYVREMVSSITSRSPYRAFLIPPLTRLPHPRVTGEPEEDSAVE